MLDISSCIQKVLKDLFSNSQVDHISVLRCLVNFDKKITFNQQEVLIEAKDRIIIKCSNTTVEYIQQLCLSYYAQNLNIIKEELRHNWSHYQEDVKKSSLGKYYTPKHLVELVYNYAKEYLSLYQDCCILDSCAGCGSFLEAFKQYNIIGRDCDFDSVALLKDMGYSNIVQDNSLLNSYREKYGIVADSKLVIVGNPPYNDTTSKNKRYGTAKKYNTSIEMDSILVTKDYGIAFLNHYASLNPDMIVVLHPLSYLIKPSNLKKLKLLTEGYILEKGTIFSSSEFGKAFKSHKTPFPVICAKYIRTNNDKSMDFNYIKQFNFSIYGEITSRYFSIKDIYTIDDYEIRKYPPTKEMIKESDIGVYHYNIRDTNSLKTSGNFSNKFSKHTITVNFNNLYQYAYLNCYRRYVPNSYLWGNISPLCNKVDLDNREFQDICIMDTIINNQTINSFNINNKQSFLYTMDLFNNFTEKIKTSRENKNLYKSFISFVSENIEDKSTKTQFSKYFITYFHKLLQNI